VTSILSPLLTATAAPPIPEAKAWARSYDGSSGPLIDLSQAVPGYPAHPETLAQLGAAAASPEGAVYGEIAGDPALRSAYADHVSRLYGASIASENVAITAGCNQAFFVAMVALARAGDAVMLPTPWYFNHKMALDMLGIETVPLPCRAENGFVPAVEDAQRLMTDRVRAVVLVTPNNPTGAIYPAETIAAFHALCAERGAALVIDETYRDFIDADGGAHDCLTKPGWNDNIIQLYSFSKAYCIPGHRIGAIVASAKIVRQIEKILDTLQICAPRPAQLVLPWAIDALAEWRSGNRAEIASRAQAFRTAIRGLDGWSIGSIGAYFAYLRHPFRTEGDRDVCARLAVENGVLCLPGTFFGGEPGFLRAAFANVGATEIAQLSARLCGRSDTRKQRAVGGTGS
jgi:aspartate/methionine/tyrosine aminotransferase